MSEDMAICMCLETSIVMAFSRDNLAIGMFIGLLLGMIVVMNFKK